MYCRLAVNTQLLARVSHLLKVHTPHHHLDPQSCIRQHSALHQQLHLAVYTRSAHWTS